MPEELRKRKKKKKKEEACGGSHQWHRNSNHAGPDGGAQSKQTALSRIVFVLSISSFEVCAVLLIAAAGLGYLEKCWTHILLRFCELLRYVLVFGCTLTLDILHNF